MLVTEATFLERDAAMACYYGHLTAAKAAALAAENGVKQLVLTHIPRRYSDNEIPVETARIFRDSRLAVDFDSLVT